jgi:hypothetical protein
MESKFALHYSNNFFRIAFALYYTIPAEAEDTYISISKKYLNTKWNNNNHLDLKMENNKYTVKTDQKLKKETKLHWVTAYYRST